MSSHLPILDILQETDQVTDWFSLGVFLKMLSKVLKDIERRFSDEGLQRCKIELFSSWVERDLDASWEQIALALEKCNQNATADRIRKCHLPPSLLAVTSQSLPPPQSIDDQPAPAAAVKTVVVEEEKVVEFRKIEISYARLAYSLKTSLDEKQVPLLKIHYFLEELLELDEGELSRASTVGDLFQLIKPHYCFLNTAILGDIIDVFIGEPLKHQLDEYKCQLKSFKESTSMSLLHEIGPQCSPSVGAPQVTIKLTNCWLKVTIKCFERFVEQIFEEHSTTLANIKVKKGCICVTWLARKSAIPSLIAQAQEKTDFMKLVGVLGLSISDIVILEQEEEADTFLSSALLRATRTDCVDAVDMLLYLGADPNTITENDQLTPLMVACLEAGNIEIAKLLLQARANINQQNKTGFTALILACNSETPNNDLVRLLIQSGADISIKTSELQRTALMVAAQCGHTSIVQYLLDEGAPVNTQDAKGVTSLMLASWKDHSEVVRVLINYGADVNIHDVLAKGTNFTALTYACNHQRTVCVDLLLAGGADPNLCGRLSPLSAACIADRGQPMDPTILDKLLSAGANPNTQIAELGNTALINAAVYGYEKGVEILLNAAADVNIQNSYGHTALHYAADRGHLAVCKILLASGALATTIASDGNTPLDLALDNDHHKVCELLRATMHSDPPATLPVTKEKPVEDRLQPHKTRRTILPSIKPRRSILPFIASISQYFKDLLLPDRAIKLRHSNQTQQAADN